MSQWSQAEKIIVGCCGIAAVLCFLPWWSMSFSMGNAGGMVASANAFKSTMGVFAFLCTVAAGGLVAADRAGMLPWGRQSALLAPFAAAAGAVVFMLVLLGQGSGDLGPMTEMVSAGRTIWFFAALIAMGVAAVQSFKRWQTSAAEGPATGDEGQAS